MATPARFTKYAVLTTNWMYGTPRDVPIGTDMRCMWWSVDDVDSQQSRDAWREAFGTFQWRAVERERACMFVLGDDVTDATNAFTNQLMDQVRLAGYAYLLNRPPVNSGGVLWLVSGDVDANRRPSSLRRWLRPWDLSLPYFIQRPAFETPLQEFRSNVWIDGWCADFTALNSARGGAWLISPPVEMAVLSFMDASINEALDFRMPALVRTIESLIALPRGSGRELFVQRAGLFSQGVATHPGFSTAGRTLEQVLGDLYQLRSDAVHGKWPLRSMRDAGREDDVALLDFAAETIARAVIKWAINNRVLFATYQTRAALENAWRDGTIPPH